MSNHRDHSKQRKNEHPLKNLPTEVLLKARSTLFSLGGALKSKNDQQQRTKLPKQNSKDKKSQEQRLKSSRSEPEFSEVRKKHRSRVDDGYSRDHNMGGIRPRPLSVGANKRYDQELEDFHGVNFPKETPLHRQFESAEEVCVQSRLVIPVSERLNQDVQMQDVSERPRKKLSFREPEIVSGGSATLGRSHKLMGVNSLSRRPNRLSLRSDPPSSNLEGVDSDLESQAMRIVRTVGQAFEVCHKMQTNSPEQPAPSTSSAPDQPVPSCSDTAASKEAASDCGASEGAVSTTKVIVEPGAAGGREERPKHLDLLPPPPRKEGKRSTQRPTVTPTINLPDLPECVTKVDLATGGEEASNDAATPLSAQHQLQLLRERLEQQAQQTRAAVAQLLLLRDQLAAEQAARCEAQARTHQLLVHNKELLEHIAALVSHLQERERGSSRPISAQQLTLLPQARTENAINEAFKPDNKPMCNGNRSPTNTEVLINLISQNTKSNQNAENNNMLFSPFCTSPVQETANGASAAPCFGGMSNDQIQNYLITKFQNMGGFPNGNEQKTSSVNYNQQYFQNCNAFPTIPLLTNHYSNSDLASLLNHKVYKDMCSSTDDIGELAQAMSLGQSEISLYSTSQPTTSKDSSPDGSSSDEGAPFIMPLSHNGTLTATGEDGRVRLIVPVSPSESTSDVAESKAEEVQGDSGHTLRVPGQEQPRAGALLAPAAPITRTTSEKVPNRSEMMTALRSQWTRHTTK